MNIFDNHDEIIAILYNKVTIIDPDHIYYLINYSNDPIQPISRAMCRMMSRLDLGEKWSIYAEKLPTLFNLDWEKYLKIANNY